jgi:hypothetical protein
VTEDVCGLGHLLSRCDHLHMAQSSLHDLVADLARCMYVKPTVFSALHPIRSVLCCAGYKPDAYVLPCVHCEKQLCLTKVVSENSGVLTELTQWCKCVGVWLEGFTGLCFLDYQVGQ